MRLLEQAYFHTGNSGITIEIQKDKDRYFLIINHGAFGHNSEFRTPILNEGQAGIMRDIFDRTSEMMISDREAGKLEKHATGSTTRRLDGVRKGLRYDPLYREYVMDQYSTISMIVGYRVTDATTKKFIRHELFSDDWRAQGGGGSCGGEPSYTPEQVRKRVVRNPKYKNPGDKPYLFTDEELFPDLFAVTNSKWNPGQTVLEYENAYPIKATDDDPLYEPDREVIKESGPDAYAEAGEDTDEPDTVSPTDENTLK